MIAPDTAPQADIAPLFGAYCVHDARLDKLRAELFEAALAETIQQRSKSGDKVVVVDAGCGEGTLSLLAAKLGGEVIAIDFDKRCVASTKRNAELNGLEDRIRVVHADATTFELDEEADILVADSLMASLGGDSHVAMVRNLRNYLKKGGVVLPAGMRNHVQLLQAQENLYGLNFTYGGRQVLLPGDVAASRRELYLDVDFNGELPPPEVASRTLVRATRNGPVNAVNMTHTTQFTPGGPHVSEPTETMMRPLVVFLDQPVEVKKGRPYNIDLQYSIGAIGAAGTLAAVTVTPSGPSGGRTSRL